MTRQNQMAAVVATLVILTVSAGIWSQARAQWGPSPISVSSAPGDQRFVRAVSDGNGGAILVWATDSPPFGLHAQRISHEGLALWGQSGVTVSGIGGYIGLIADGQGGVLIAGTDTDNIHAQRLGPGGQPLWATGGVVISSLVRRMAVPAWSADGNGGGIVAWLDRRGMGCDVYAARITGNGSQPWPAGGIPIRIGPCDSVFLPYDRPSVALAHDGSSGALIAWTDYGRNAADIFAQRVDSSGTTLWAVNGIPLVSDTEIQMTPVMVTDGLGGAIIAWRDSRGYQFNLFAQRVDANGHALWDPGGVLIGPPYLQKEDHAIVSDDKGGAIVSWDDGRTGQWVRYVQRISPDGANIWASDVALSATSMDTQSATLVEDGMGGAISTWCGGASPFYLRAQRVDAGGSFLWAPGGVSITPDMDPLYWPDVAAIDDGAGGVIAAWGQEGPADADVVAQHVPSNGPPVAVESGPSVGDDVFWVTPNPTRGAADFRVSIPRSSGAQVVIFDVRGRRVRDLGTVSSDGGVLRWDGRDASSRPVDAGIYLARVVTATGSRSLRVAVVR